MKNKISKISPFKSLGMGMSYIHKGDKSSFFIASLLGIIGAIKPIINIVIPAKIIQILATTQNVSELVIYSAIGLLGNLILFIMGQYFSNKIDVIQRNIITMEKNNLSKRVFNIEYPFLENAGFTKKLNEYKENLYSPFSQIIYLVINLFAGVFGLIISIALIYPFILVIFKTSGESFFAGPQFVYVIAGVLLVSIASVLIISAIINKKVYTETNKFLSLNRVHSFYNDMLNNYNTGKDVRIFAEQKIIERSATEKILNEGIKIEKKIINLRSASTAFTAIIGALLGFGVYVIVGLKSLAGFIDISSLILCVGGLLQVMGAFNSLGTLIGSLNGIAPRINDYFNLMNSVSNDNNEKVFDEFKKIEVRNVDFRYADELPLVLKNVSLDINCGDKIAIVGENGSGKSTFVKLLCGLYQTNSGQILVDGDEYQIFNNKEWWQKFSVVFQDFKLFAFKLGQNIAASEEFSEAKLNAVIEQVDINEMIGKMPNGIDTYLYKNCNADGVEVSGGEAQRIAIARAVYKDSPIMILDEPTASLDPFAEQEIYEKLKDLTENKTVIYITHRLSSCYFCNKIAVFDQGELVQFGNHRELIENTNGKYYELWMAQAQYYVKKQ